MQDNWQEFDRQLRSVLQDAGEKAPRRVWRAVSGRLDSAAPAFVWWKWAVPAFAAAAIAAGLFFSGTFGRIGTGTDSIGILAEVTGQEQEASGLTAGLNTDNGTAQEGAEGTERPAARHAAARTAYASPAATSENEAQAADAATENVITQNGVTAEEAPADEDKAPARDKAPSRDKAGESYGWNAAANAYRPRKHAKFSGLYAQGGLSGNDSNISYRGNGISYMAPGAGSEDAGISESGPSTYGVPFTVGLGVRFRLADKLSIGTGVDYSLLSRSFKGSYSGGASKFEGTVFHDVQYLGVPVNLYYELLRPADGSFDIYAKGGFSADYCISNRYRLSDPGFSVITDKAGGFQFGAMLGLGLEFKLSDKLGLYVDPSVRYWFHGGSQPKSVRTDKPFMFNFDAGLRFNL